jgi:hypothetical protein
MPLELSQFPAEVQVAFFMFSLLSDEWEGTNGTYMGKRWEPLDYYFNLYDVDDKKVILYIMKMYERAVVSFRMEEAENKRKIEERKSRTSGGKQYTHNVSG